MRIGWTAWLGIGLLVGPATDVARADWRQYASGACRNASSATGPVNVSAVLWNASEDGVGRPLVIEGASSPVVFGGRVYCNARHSPSGSYTANKVIAFDQGTGAFAWEQVVAKGAANSWSSPAVDAAHGTVLLGSGNRLYAFDAGSGGPAWTTQLDRNVVNCSPLVADGLEPGRAFIVDYDPFGGLGQLYCVNTSAFDAGGNPFQPGEIVWVEGVGGTSGATPAYADGIVFLASSAGLNGFPDSGFVWAFEVNSPAGARLRWSVPIGEGFFGGVTVVAGFVYAAGYSFAGTGDNSLLAKLRASDGAVQWVVPCERTSSIPIVTGDRVFLSAGIQGFGSAPKVQCFRDDGAAATKIWDTSVDTGGALIVGGWTQQPAVAGESMYVGKLPLSGDFYGPATDLFLLDLAKSPVQAGFVLQQRVGLGSSPALSDGRLYTVGAGGLYALATAGDFDADGRVTGADVQGFVAAVLAGAPSPQQVALGDFDGNLVLDSNDAILFASAMLGN